MDKEGIRQFYCPISYQIFADPVVCSDGHTYEKTGITAWLSKNSTSPITRNPVNKVLYNNFAIKTLINDYLEKNPDFIVDQPKITTIEPPKDLINNVKYILEKDKNPLETIYELLNERRRDFTTSDNIVHNFYIDSFIINKNYDALFCFKLFTTEQCSKILNVDKNYDIKLHVLSYFMKGPININIMSSISYNLKLNNDIIKYIFDNNIESNVLENVVKYGDFNIIEYILQKANLYYDNIFYDICSNYKTQENLEKIVSLPNFSQEFQKNIVNFTKIDNTILAKAIFTNIFETLDTKICYEYFLKYYTFLNSSQIITIIDKGVDDRFSYYACSYSNQNIIKKLDELNVFVNLANKKGRTPLMRLTKNKDISSSFLIYMIDKYNDSKQNYTKKVLEHYVTKFCNETAVTYIIKKNVNLDIKDINGYIPPYYMLLNTEVSGVIKIAMLNNYNDWKLDIKNKYDYSYIFSSFSMNTININKILVNKIINIDYNFLQRLLKSYSLELIKCFNYSKNVSTFKILAERFRDIDSHQYLVDTFLLQKDLKNIVQYSHHIKFLKNIIIIYFLVNPKFDLLLNYDTNEDARYLIQSILGTCTNVYEFIINNIKSNTIMHYIIYWQPIVVINYALDKNKFDLKAVNEYNETLMDVLDKRRKYSSIKLEAEFQKIARKIENK